MPTCKPAPSSVPTEMFAPPSAEHRFLVRRAAWLVSPPDNRGGVLARFVRMVMVAPMTQLTFLSFDLQLFLYGVFHVTWTARAGHFVFQAGVTLWLLVAAAALLPAGAWLLGAVLWLWYAAMARQYRLWGWAALMVPVVAGFAAAASWMAKSLGAGHHPTWLHPLPLEWNPWLWALLCAFLVGLSHAPEPKLPPRTVEGDRWLGLFDYILRHPELPSRRAVRAVRVGLFPFWGMLDELWASPRLVPYGFLLLLFRLGYRPDVWNRHQEWLSRAAASGNPALDYVGIGGGTPLTQRAE
ncbi:MAG: hypothetical protein HY902_06280 [Deltaproteobacteria bacterium]|nr:hypothetical protein [Deltaproteobacteria bacterium]